MRPVNGRQLRGTIQGVLLSAALAVACNRGEDPKSAATTVKDPSPAESEGSSADARGPFPPPDGTAPIITLPGATLELNPKDPKLSATLWQDGQWEPHQTQLLLEHLQPGDTFVDVGANLGYYTVLAATKVGPTGRVFAFEPDPESYALLVRNVQRNGLKQVMAINKAAGEASGTLRLFLSSAGRGDHRSYDPGGGRTSVEVDVVTLDQHLRAAGGDVHVIKIDTRGAECAVLAGMKTLFTEHRELSLAVAYYPRFVEAMGYQPAECFGALANHGYALQLIDETAAATRPVTVESLRDVPDGALFLPRRSG